MSSAPLRQVVTGQPGPDPAGDPAGDLAGDLARALVAAVGSVVRGSESTVRLVVCALLAGGHVLIEDLPGTGKTTMARALAASLGGTFARVQATADLMPADITGSGIWEPAQGTFRFVPGPVFANVLVIDELNRTSPRTQSAFMEALEEGAVTVDGVRHRLPDPFFAIATQNPADQHGTFPLPEGELDRFTVSVSQGELDLPTEAAVVREQLVRPSVDRLSPVTDPEQLRRAQQAVRHIHVSDAVLGHAVTIVRATRTDSRVALGASSRAALWLVRTAQAYAALEGRTFTTPDDTKAVAPAVLAHRVLMHGSGHQRGAAHAVIGDLLGRIPVPLTG